jgi:hypothetical protein
MPGVLKVRVGGAWVDVAAAGAVEVYEQADEPAGAKVGSLWIDTDAAVVYGPKWQQVTMAAYLALAPPDPDTLYIIIG